MNLLCVSTDLASAELAQWVQAIGSILAIIAGFIGIWTQHHLDTKRAREDREKAETSRLRSAAYLALAAAKTIQQVFEASKDSQEAEMVVFRVRWRSYFAQAEQSLMLPFHEIPDAEAVRALLRIRVAILDVVTCLEEARGHGTDSLSTVAFVIFQRNMERIQEGVVEASATLRELAGVVDDDKERS